MFLICDLLLGGRLRPTIGLFFFIIIFFFLANHALYREDCLSCFQKERTEAVQMILPTKLGRSEDWGVVPRSILKETP